METVIYAALGGEGVDLSARVLDEVFSRALAGAVADAGKGRALIVPPDVTRFHSMAGFFTDICVRELGADRIKAVLPALGTHQPMTAAELARMFPATPAGLVRVHDWRNDVVELGRIEEDWIRDVTGGAVSYDWPVQVNRMLRDAELGLVVSIGQVVPHEVIGMANHTKNIFVGCGGKEAIDKSHFAGAAYGMERMMGRADTPVRAMFDEGFRRYHNDLPPVLWVLTVVGTRSDAEAANAGKPRGSAAVRGLFIGFGRECFEKAAALARKVNVDLLDEAPKKVVVYLEPEEFRTTWLGNKAVYRTRMAIADGGELLIMAPALERFGEDKGVDALIRKYGYRPAALIREKVNAEPDLAESLSAAAHLIHGCGEGRFTVRYCPGHAISRAEIESVGFEWGDLAEASARYDIDRLSLGWNTMDDGERIFFVPNPAMGLWAERRRFEAA
ncbi:MAG: lactate racemase domain-containing protein [Spirochaetaceae bacterium]|jgi:nickel-dependent lactate racemase|nr:lactate racemase domain-containing protein [Spirochaetaceae bacterium]